MPVNWKRIGLWAVVGTIIFSYMHIADELWSQWDFGATQVTSSVTASVLGVLPLAVGLWAFGWMLQDRPWGYVVGLFYGILMLIAGSTHLLDAAGMDGFRYGVVALMVLSALGLVVASLREVLETRPWAKGVPTGA